MSRFQNHQYKASVIKPSGELGRSHLYSSHCHFKYPPYQHDPLDPELFVAPCHTAHRDAPQGRKSHWSLTLPPGDNWKSILEFCREALLSPIVLPPAGEFLSFSLEAKLFCLMCFFQASMLFSSNSLLLNKLKLLKI